MSASRHCAAGSAGSAAAAAAAAAAGAGGTAQAPRLVPFNTAISTFQPAPPCQILDDDVLVELAVLHLAHLDRGLGEGVGVLGGLVLAPLAPARQWLTLLHFSAKRMRFLLDTLGRISHQKAGDDIDGA
jgi:hypothetical protein